MQEAIDWEICPVCKHDMHGRAEGQNCPYCNATEEEMLKYSPEGLPEATVDDVVVCPWCQHQHSDSSEFFSGSRNSVTAECEECGKEIEIERDFSVTYWTHPIKKKTDEG